MKLIKNKKGFTLVELLAVLVILALLALLAGSAIMGSINKAEEQVTKTQEKAILNAAEKWSIDNSEKFDDTESEEINYALDVVFVLDVSGSMESSSKVLASDGVTKISRTNAAMTAINSAFKILVENNPEHRIALVVYGQNVNTILPLNYYRSSNDSYVKYVPSSNSTYGNIKSGNLTYADGTAVTFDHKMQNAVTYTQGGIIFGSKVLKDSGNKKNRIPVMILLSDGSPTAYMASNPKASCSGTCGGSENTNAGYYMIKAAINEKIELTKSYGAPAFVYTIGLGISENTFGSLVLNPTKENIETGLSKSSRYKELSNILKDENGVNSYSYADKAFNGTMDETILKDIFTEIAGEVIEATKVTRVCVTVKELYDKGYLSKQDIKMADGEATSTYVLMMYKEETNQYSFALAKDELQKATCEELLVKGE